jgi:hypothetical protein
MPRSYPPRVALTTLTTASVTGTSACVIEDGLREYAAGGIAGAK